MNRASKFIKETYPITSQQLEKGVCFGIDDVGNLALSFAKEEVLNFTDWLITNCELSDDQTIWSYDSEDYSLDGIYEVFKQSLKE